VTGLCSPELATAGSTLPIFPVGQSVSVPNVWHQYENVWHQYDETHVALCNSPSVKATRHTGASEAHTAVSRITRDGSHVTHNQLLSVNEPHAEK
jgi:hypothetical protein